MLLTSDLKLLNLRVVFLLVPLEVLNVEKSLLKFKLKLLKALT